MGGVPHDETFAVEDGFLVRRVVPRRGRPYEHRCPADAFENVAWAIDDREAPYTLDDLQAATRLPFTQVAVMLAFLKSGGASPRPTAASTRPPAGAFTWTP